MMHCSLTEINIPISFRDFGNFTHNFLSVSCLAKSSKIEIGTFIFFPSHWSKSCYLFLVFCLLSITVEAQQKDNPFELNHRLEKPVEKNLSPNASPVESSNPFDIKRVAKPDLTKPTPTKPKVEKVPLPKTKPTTISSADNSSFKFWLMSIMVALTAIIFTLFRSSIQKTYKAFVNDNVLRLLFREINTFFSWPFFLYAFFSFNAGVFLYLLQKHFNIPSVLSNLQLFLYGAGAVTIFYIVKHFMLNTMAYVFPLQKEVSLYNFTVTVFNIILGILLIPFNLFIAFSPSSFGTLLIYFLLGTLILIYLYRSLRGIFIASRYLTFNKFHFFIYLCTIEIAPLAIVIKIVLNQRG